MTDPCRTGGDLVAESLAALGATTVFGLPGQHALGLFDALRRSPLAHAGFRVENNAGFAADAYARVTGRVAPLLVSTGPGALLTLAALQESAAASVPVLGISSQVPVAGLGGARKGYLHELPDQAASFRGIVKSARTVRAPAQIPSALAAAWAEALEAPRGPVWVEIPQDVLLAPAGVPPVSGLTAAVRALEPRGELTAAAVELLESARRPAILAGGGVVRAGAQAPLLALAEKLDAPVATTFGGKGAFPWEHPLALQSWLEDQHTTEFLAEADVLLVAGSGLGELSTNYGTFSPRGSLIHIEADLGRLEAHHTAAVALHSDAGPALAALAARVTPRPADGDGPGEGARRAAQLLERVRDRLDAQDLTLERELLAAVRAALPDAAPSFWDMTILGYWAWSGFDPRAGAMHSAQGAGGLGYAFPAALGAAVAGAERTGDRTDAAEADGPDGPGSPGGSGPHRPVLAVSGDGGAMYSLAELATARQHRLPVTWLIVDDGGYGILREYMTESFGAATGTELARPDFTALAESFGVRATRTTPSRLRADLAAALAEPGPSVVVLPAVPRMFAPTHH